MEAVENVGQIVLWDGLADVFDGNIGLASLFIEPDGYGAPGGGKLNGVVRQVIDDLRNGVALGENDYGILRKLGIDVEIFLLCPPLKAEHALEQKLGKVKFCAL